MDFANRGARPAGQDGLSPNVQSAGTSQKKSKSSDNKLMKILMIVLLFAGTLVGVALIVLMIFGRSTGESSYVNKNEYQAVFLNGGQVYFGKIGKYTDTYLTLKDIYYLRVNQQVQPGQTSASNDVSLAKLGNELHGPEDQMVLNRSEVQFWENLKADGQVVKAITAYKANPNAANSTTTPSTTGTNQQQTNTTPTTTTPTTTKKP
jgi:hypothetical protein